MRDLYNKLADDEVPHFKLIDGQLSSRRLSRFTKVLKKNLMTIMKLF